MHIKLTVSIIIKNKTTNISPTTSYNIKKLNWLMYQIKKNLNKNW